MTIDFTKQELLLLRKIVESTPLQGNIQTLPLVLSEIANILHKIKAAQEGPSPAVELDQAE